MNPKTLTALTLIAGLFLVLTLRGAIGDPTGASILTSETAGVPTSSPDSRADPRATITTIVLNAVQQDQNWKAYVGNVTGRLSLDNAAGFTIYDWTLTGGIAGEVYVSRWASPVFTNLSCANDANVSVEETYFGMAGAALDNINNTYGSLSHDAVVIGGFGTITSDTCKSTATYINDTAQTIDGTQEFQALVLQDTSDQLIFTTLIADNQTGYDGNFTNNKTYDFQIIVPESAVNATPTTYYFWTELDG